jgi:sialate O-acetylesterase
MKLTIPFVGFLVLTNTFLLAQTGLWNGKKCAVVLTYDDALHVHLDKAIPALDSVGFKGTFYLAAFASGSKDRIEDWRRAAANGHELANHTLFHPCVGEKPGREWVSRERNLNAYSMERMLDEIRMTNVFLKAIDGKTERTFAYPCGDVTVGDSSYIDLIRGDFVSARGVNSVMHAIDDPEVFNVGAYMINGESGEVMINLVKEAIKNEKMLVFLFHGVGGEHGLNVGMKAHHELLSFLKQHEKEIWVTPFLDATRFLISRNAQKTKK